MSFIKTGAKLRLVWWHELDYIYSDQGSEGFHVTGYTCSLDGPKFNPYICAPYGTNAVVLELSEMTPRVKVRYSDEGKNFNIHVKKQWLTNKVEIPKPGDFIKTRCKVLFGSSVKPRRDPHYWRNQKATSYIKSSKEESKLWTVVAEDDGFLQLNTGVWVSCGDVYIPAQIKKLAQ